MPEIHIESNPNGAEVTFDGVPHGTTPLTISIGEEPVGLAAFRAECLSGGNVISPWSTLKTRLEDQTVSRLWWDLTRNERYSIADMAIHGTLFYHVYYKRAGRPNCEGGIGEWSRTVCVNEAIIRCLKFAEFPDYDPYWSPNADECYYERDVDRGEHCYVSNTPYRLPCHFVSRIGGATANHAMAAIQIENNYDSLSSWVVFQYTSFDIQPGSKQMPHGSTITFSRPHGYQCGVSYGTNLAEFAV